MHAMAAHKKKRRKAFHPDCWKVKGIREDFSGNVKFKLRPANGNGSVSQAKGVVSEEYSRKKKERMQRRRRWREDMTRRRQCSSLLRLKRSTGIRVRRALFLAIPLCPD